MKYMNVKYCLSGAENKEARINIAFDILFEELEQELRCKNGEEVKNETRYYKSFRTLWQG